MPATNGNNRQAHTHTQPNVECIWQHNNTYKHTHIHAYSRVCLSMAMKFAVAHWQQATKVETLMKMKNLMWHATCVENKKL